MSEQPLTIATASDHAGFELRNALEASDGFIAYRNSNRARGAPCPFDSSRRWRISCR